MKRCIILLAIVFSSCESKNVAIEQTNTTINGTKIEMYIIDSCEYIGTVHKNNGDMLSHKGNCKFCKERSKTSKPTPHQ